MLGQYIIKNFVLHVINFKNVLFQFSELAEELYNPEFILQRVSASFVATLGREDAYTLWSRVAVTHRSCIITRVFAVNIGEIRRILFKNQIKEHIYCLLNPIPPCFLASKCLNLIGRAEIALSNHTSFNKYMVFMNGKHVYSK